MVKFTTEELYLLINLLEENIILTNDDTSNLDFNKFCKEVQNKIEKELF